MKTPTIKPRAKLEAKISAMIPEDWANIRIKKGAPSGWEVVPRGKVISALVKAGARLVKIRTQSDYFELEVYIAGKYDGTIVKEWPEEEIEWNIPAMIPEAWTNIRIEKPSGLGVEPRGVVVSMLVKAGARLVKDRSWGDDFALEVRIDGKYDGTIMNAAALNLEG